MLKSLVALTTTGKAGPRTVTIGWNANPEHSPIGALRTEFGRTVFIGVSPLRPVSANIRYFGYDNNRESRETDTDRWRESWRTRTELARSTRDMKH